jgi:hypothetical protein
MEDFMLWLFIAGIIVFAGLRLWWIYRPGVGQVFWQTDRAKQLYVWAGTILAIMLPVVFLSAHYWVLLLAVPAIYVLLAFTAVKIDDRGIMANAVFARWQDIVRLHQEGRDSTVMVITRYSWRKIKMNVPQEKLVEFRKMLAAKGMRLQSPVAGLAEESFA